MTANGNPSKMAWYKYDRNSGAQFGEAHPTDVAIRNPRGIQIIIAPAAKLSSRLQGPSRSDEESQTPMFKRQKISKTQPPMQWHMF